MELKQEISYDRLKLGDLLVIIFIYLSVFINSFVFFKEPFEFYLGYLIFAVLLPGFISKYGFNRSLFFIFLTLLVTGLFNVLVNNNTAGQFFKVYIGLMLSYFFYYYVILEFNYDIERLFKWYLKGSYYVSVIGVVQFISYQVGFRPGYDFTWLFNKWGFIEGGNFGIRINSVFSEPTYLGSTLSAAFFISLYNVIRRETFGLNRLQSILIIVVYILSFSGLGQIGIFLTLILLAISFGLIRYIFVAIPLAIFLFNYLHENVKDFRDRYDSLIGLFTGEKFKLGQTHGSSFILYNNYVVALENFKSNFLFGTGIGSHGTAFEKYTKAGDIKVWGFNLNSADANSMLLRLISETGLFGVLIFLFIIIKCYIRRNENVNTHHWLISNAILVMMLLNLFRQGHYFLNGFPFFVIMYYFNQVSYKYYLETGRMLYERSFVENEIS
jgi:O-antigen ligase